MKSIDKILIRDFLTIRYSPKNPPIPQATSRDFLTRNSDPTGKKSEKLLIESITFSEQLTKSLEEKLIGGILKIMMEMPILLNNV